jgi:Ca2+-binding EF-hand superfamily protein
MTSYSSRTLHFDACALLLALVSIPAGTCLAQVPPPTTATATEHFETLDTNKDGRVGKDEYESSGLFAQMDGNHDNRITSGELEAILGPQKDGTPSAADRIRVADRNDDGELSDEELRRSAEMRFAWLDRNDDGYLDLAEMKSGFGIPAPPQY